jgi:hypothetical protein
MQSKRPAGPRTHHPIFVAPSRILTLCNDPPQVPALAQALGSMPQLGALSLRNDGLDGAALQVRPEGGSSLTLAEASVGPPRFIQRTVAQCAE